MPKHVNNMKRQSVILLVLLLKSFEAEGLIFSSIGNDVLAAAQPIQREIELLQEKLDAFEAKHDTLEAATEQFRLQSKTLKEKLKVEQQRYDELAQQRADLQTRYRDEVQDVSQKFKAAQRQQAALEKELKKVLFERNVTQLELQGNLVEKASQLSTCTGNFEKSEKENSMLKELLREKDEELSETKTTYQKLQQELFIANKQLGDFEQKAKLTLWSVYWKKISSAELTAEMLVHVQESGKKFMSETLPEYQKTLGTFAARTKEQFQGFQHTLSTASISLVGVLHNLPSGLESAETIGATAVSIYKSLSAYASSLELINSASRALSKRLDGPLSVARSCLAGLHQISVFILEWTMIAGMNYYINNVGGSRSDKIFSAGLFLKANSNLAVLAAEIFLGLLAFNFAWRSLKPSRRHPPAKKLLQLRHRPSSPQPARSLLRSAGGLSRRAQ